MKALTKTTCTRCGGSGSFSFHLVRGTVCFGCEGTGFQMVDLKKQQERQAAAAKRQAEKEAFHANMRAAYEAVVAEMNALLGPFDVTTQLGVHQLDQAVAKKFGRAMHVIRNERMKAAA